MTKSELIEMATTIAEQEKKIGQLTESIQTWKKEYEEYKKLANDYYKELAALRKQMKEDNNAEATALLKEALRMAQAENKELHKRTDAAFAGVAIDADAKRHMLIDIIKRVNGIQKTLEAMRDE